MKSKSIGSAVASCKPRIGSIHFFWQRLAATAILAILASRLPSGRALDLEEEVVRYRESLPLPVHLVFENEASRTIKRKVNSDKIKYELWLTADSARMDWCGWNPIAKRWNEVWQSCFNSQEWINAAPPRLKPGEILSVSLDANDGSALTREQIGDLRIADLRPIGMSVSGFGASATYGTRGFLTRVDRTNVRESRETVDGMDCRRIDYQTKDGADVTLWIAEEFGPSLAAAQLVYRKEQLEASVKNVLEKYPRRGRWYLKSSTTEDKQLGSVYSRTTLRVLEAEFGAEIDPEVFTLTGMNLELGRPVVDRRSGNGVPMLWDGKQLVPPFDSNGRRTRIMEPEPEPGGWSVPWIASAFALAALGGVLLWFALRKR